MRDADGAAGRLRAQIVRHLQELAAVLLGGRNLGQIVAAVNADGVFGVAHAVILVGAAAGDEDELAGRGLAVRILRRRQAGAHLAGAQARAVLVDGQGLSVLVDDDAVVRVRLHHAELVALDVAAHERAVLVAECFNERPAVVTLLDHIEALGDAGYGAELLAAAVGRIIDVSGFALAHIHAHHRAGQRSPDFRVGGVGRQAPVAGVGLRGGVAHAHADEQALVAHRVGAFGVLHLLGRNGRSGCLGRCGRLGRGGGGLRGRARRGGGGSGGRDRLPSLTRGGGGPAGRSSLAAGCGCRSGFLVLAFRNVGVLGDGLGGNAVLAHHIRADGVEARLEQIAVVIDGIDVKAGGIGVNLLILGNGQHNVAALIKQIHVQEAREAGADVNVLHAAAFQAGLRHIGELDGRHLGKGLARLLGGGGSGRGRARQIQAQQHSQCAAQMFHIQANSFRDAPPARTSGADGDSIIQYTYTILTYHHTAKRPRMQEQRRKKRFIWYAFLTRRGPHGTIRGIQKGGAGHGG